MTVGCYSSWRHTRYEEEGNNPSCQCLPPAYILLVVAQSVLSVIVGWYVWHQLTFMAVLIMPSSSSYCDIGLGVCGSFLPHDPGARAGFCRRSHCWKWQESLNYCFVVYFVPKAFFHTLLFWSYTGVRQCCFECGLERGEKKSAETFLWRTISR